MYGGEKDAALKMLGMLFDDLENTSNTLEKCYLEKNAAGLRGELHRTLGGVVYLRPQT